MLLVPLLAVASSWGAPLWGGPQEALASGARRRISRHAVLRAGCLFAALLGWYAGDVATKLTVAASAASAAAAAQQQQQRHQQPFAGSSQEGLGVPQGLEILEVFSPAIDTRPKLLAR